MTREIRRTANQVGDVVGASVQAGEIHGGVHVYVTESGARASGLPDGIASLLRAQVRAARDLPYRLPGARRPSLATVYVRQDLGSGSEESVTEQPAPILDGRGRLVDVPAAPVVRPAVRPPTKTVRAALDGDDHLLITGGPGQGKSTLSLRLAADIAAGGPATPITEPVVPLRLTARELAARLDLPFTRALADAVLAEYGAHLDAAVEDRTLGGRVAGLRWLLLVDGLDEVADATRRDRLVSVLAGWASPESPYRVVVTTRPIEGAALAPLQRIGAARYELQPFDEEALRGFADNWFDGDADRAYRFVRQIRRAHLDELVRVPLLATIAAIIFEHDDRPLPDNQYELYEAYLKYLRSGHTGPFEEHRDGLLEHLGRVRLEADTSLLTAAREWLRDNSAAVPDPDDVAAYLTSVGPLARRGDDLRFLHHSFAEHLAATARAPPAGPLRPGGHRFRAPGARRPAGRARPVRTHGAAPPHPPAPDRGRPPGPPAAPGRFGPAPARGPPAGGTRAGGRGRGGRVPGNRPGLGDDHAAPRRRHPGRGVPGRPPPGPAVLVGRPDGRRERAVVVAGDRGGGVGDPPARPRVRCGGRGAAWRGGRPGCLVGPPLGGGGGVGRVRRVRARRVRAWVACRAGGPLDQRGEPPHGGGRVGGLRPYRPCPCGACVDGAVGPPGYPGRGPGRGRDGLDRDRR
ncbi:NACHT domain-containing protein [Saccharothrix obliqua]|uniref:NACHT domain-containing protein n=1 Tax=Saccharothrix obliqua TaxID=2861747 RepID=UPI001C5F1804|nr:NACHT domain-containing protein [Saccharothrix obliqua]MBW4718488.1 NACHT domain-containing protein [Saccharothrix obliqua]